MAIFFLKVKVGEFLGGSVIITPYFHCRGLGLIPGWGTKHPEKAVGCSLHPLPVNQIKIFGWPKSLFSTTSHGKNPNKLWPTQYKVKV